MKYEQEIEKIINLSASLINKGYSSITINISSEKRTFNFGTLAKSEHPYVCLNSDGSLVVSGKSDGNNNLYRCIPNEIPELINFCFDINKDTGKYIYIEFYNSSSGTCEKYLKIGNVEWTVDEENTSKLQIKEDSFEDLVKTLREDFLEKSDIKILE